MWTLLLGIIMSAGNAVGVQAAHLTEDHVYAVLTDGQLVRAPVAARGEVVPLAKVSGAVREVTVSGRRVALAEGWKPAVRLVGPTGEGRALLGPSGVSNRVAFDGRGVLAVLGANKQPGGSKPSLFDVGPALDPAAIWVWRDGLDAPPTQITAPNGTACTALAGQPKGGFMVGDASGAVFEVPSTTQRLKLPGEVQALAVGGAGQLAAAANNQVVVSDAAGVKTWATISGEITHLRFSGDRVLVFTRDAVLLIGPSRTAARITVRQPRDAMRVGDLLVVVSAEGLSAWTLEGTRQLWRRRLTAPTVNPHQPAR